MSKIRINILISSFYLFFLAACQNYSLSINQNQIYHPSALYTDFRLMDSALQHCVDSIIAESALKKAEQVTHINCGPSRISSVEGLEVFHHLQHLALANNAIQYIDTLSGLKQLKHLDLENNPIRDLEALLPLKHLEYVNLKGLVKVNCNQIFRLEQANPALVIKPPEHCTGAL